MGGFLSMKKIYPQTFSRFKDLRIELLPNLFGVRDMEFYRVSSNAHFLYRPIEIKKKSGGVRQIYAPSGRLKFLQRRILSKLLEKVRLPPFVFGGVKGKSIINNASCHLGSKYLLNLDIENFFPSVNWQLVRKLFIDLGCDSSVADVLTRFTTLDYRLPQGAPTSPYILNLVLSNLDRRFFLLACSNRLTYSRYFDDITISGGKRLIGLEESFLEILRQEGFTINLKKKYLYGPSEDKKVTGLVLKSGGRMELVSMSGLLKYLNELITEGLSNLDGINLEKEKQTLLGKIEFVKSIDKVDGQNLNTLFNKI